jgi:hypothetical protein
MSKFMSGLFGTLVIVALMLFAYYLRWSTGAEAYRDEVLANIAHHQQRFNAGNNVSQLSIAYESADVTGFPFAKSVRLYRPSVRLALGAEQFYIDSATMELTPQDEANKRYAVVISPDLSVGYKSGQAAQETYRVHIREAPKIWLQAREGDADSSAMWAEYGVAFVSNKLILDVSNQAKSEQIGFPTMATQMPLWGSIPSNVNYPVQMFVGMLREALVFR